MTTQPAPLTEVEQLKLRVLRLEGQLLDRAVQDWTTKTAALKAEFEATRAGWSWDPGTGQWRATTAPDERPEAR